MEPSNAACRALSSTGPTWDGVHINITSIPFWHRFQNNCLHSYTRGWVWWANFLDNIALIELMLPGHLTSAMCRRAEWGALSSIVKTPAGLWSYVQINPHIFEVQQSPHIPQSKSHPYKKCTMVHTKTSESIAREAPPMNASPLEHWQISSTYARLPKGFQGVLVAHAALRTRMKLYPMTKYQNILWCSDQCSAPPALQASLSKGSPIDRKQQQGIWSSSMRIFPPVVVCHFCSSY
jgi:hypothetical protein